MPYPECLNPPCGYADLGVDRLMCLQQMGGLADGAVSKSIRLIGELIPDPDPAATASP